MLTFADRLNAQVADSAIGRWFRLEGSGHAREREGSRFMTDVRAGITTWAAMAYIISVNASIVSDSGGTCVCEAANNCVTDAAYLQCIQEVKQDLITSTAAMSALASILMGALANLPVGMAPGMGLNAYFTYSVVGYHGSGFITYREALAAVFLEGWIFFILSLLGLRQWLARIMPQSLVLAVGAGIGLYIAFIGLTSGGLNVIGGDTTNLVGLGGCLESDWLEGLPYFCGSQVLRSPTTWLGIFTGGILTILLMLYRVKGSLLIAGDQLFDFFKQVVTWHPLQHIGNALDYNYGKGKVWYALITFLYVDILDTTGTLYSMVKFAGLRDPVTLDFENSTIAYCVDAFSISMGALAGTSPVTAFIESATGIAEGGKTGITAVVTGLLFFLSVFFAPIFRLHSTLGYRRRARGRRLAHDPKCSRYQLGLCRRCCSLLSSPFYLFLCHTTSHSIAYGVIVGVFSYVIINGFVWIVSKISNNAIMPPNYDASEPWVVPPGGIVPAWLNVLFKRNTRIVEESPSEYPFQVRQRHSNISVDTTSQENPLTPRKSGFKFTSEK
ncbi:permease family-domain-containing protein [Suillus variegatus]|nr:permease family-domain-containing protein [Suillus variegatus]